MKSILQYNSFDKITKKIIFSISNFDIKKLYAIINVTNQTIIYASGIIGKGYSSFSTTQIILEYNTNLINFNNSDQLIIIYEQDVAFNTGNTSDTTQRVTLNNELITLLAKDSSLNSLFTELQNLNNKTANLGQQLALNSNPVVLTASQLSALTPQINSLTNTELRSAALNVSLLTNTPVLQSGSTTAVTQSNPTNLNANVSNLGVFATQVTSNVLASDAATATKQDTQVTALNLLHTDLINPIPTGTNSIGQVTANAGTNLNTSTLALQTTQASILAQTTNLDVLLSTRLKSSDALSSVTTITNPVKIEDNGGSITIDNLNLDVPISSILKPSDTLTAVTSVGSIINALPSGNNSIGQVSTNGTIFNFSTLNSTTAQLTPGNIFNGTIESIINQQAFSILIFSSQTGILTINQFIDVNGTKLIQTLTYNIIANTGFARSGAANGNFLQIVFQNTGSLTTTGLQIDTAFGTIPSITQLNNNPSAINEVNGMPFSLGTNASNVSLPVVNSIESISGNITTQNLNPNGIATTNSAIDLLLNSSSLISIQTTGTYTGALSIQVTNDGLKWETISNNFLQNTITGVFFSTIPSGANGIYQIKVGGLFRVRITGLLVMTGTAVVTIKAISNTSIVSIDNALPSGSNLLGKVSIDQTTPGTTNKVSIGTDGTVAISSIPNVVVSNFPATQSVSATSLPLPTGSATETTLASVNTKLPSGLTVTANRLQVELPTGGTGLTNTELRASAVTVLNSIESIGGNITTQNSVPNGVATAGSAVDLLLNGNSLLAIQTTGTYTGALSLQITNDGTRWETITSSCLQNAITGVNTPTIPSASIAIYQVEVAGFLRARITGLSAITGTAVITLRAVTNTSLVSLEQSIPTGTNSIGNIGTLATVTTVSTLSNTTQLTPGVAATNLGKAEDAVAVSGDTGVAVLGLRNDALTSNVSASGDYIVPVTDIYGSFVTKDQQRHKRTYSTAFVVVPAATATDIFQMIGSASTTVAITKIVISGTQTTGGMTDIFFAKRSTVNTGGTFTNSAIVRHQTSDAVATAVGTIYTVNPTTRGTLIGNVRIQSIPFATVTDKTNNNVEINFGEKGKPFLLLGITEALAIDLNNATITGGSIKISIEFTEE